MTITQLFNLNTHLLFKLKLVYLSLQDGSFRVMLQALTKEGCWKPIQGSEPVYCPTMEAPYKIIPPKMANRFITPLPNKGDFKTKFRYKILSEVCFYYSNEFEGKQIISMKTTV
jgi:hypothetical protein